MNEYLVMSGTAATGLKAASVSTSKQVGRMTVVIVTMSLMLQYLRLQRQMLMCLMMPPATVIAVA